MKLLAPEIEASYATLPSAAVSGRVAYQTSDNQLYYDTGSAWVVLRDTGGRRNFLIGGDFASNPWQRGTSFAAIATATYWADRWSNQKVGTMVYTIARDTDVPLLASGKQVKNSALITVTTAQAAIAAGDFAFFSQKVEGYNFIPLAQQAFVGSFWVKSALTGTYCCQARNSGNDRSYISQFTVSAANTWEKKTVQFTASPSGGTWNYTTGSGVEFGVALACGTTFQGLANNWGIGNFIATSSQVNFFTTNGNTIRFADFQLELGSNVTPFESPSIRDVVAECQRYWQSIKSTIFGYAGAASVEARFSRSFQEKRAIPTVTYTTGTRTNCATAGQVAVTTNKLDHRAVGTAIGGFADDGATFVLNAEL